MKIESRETFKLIGRSTEIQGQGVNDENYSKEKTEFFKELFNQGMMKELMPISTDKKGYAVIIPIEKGIKYFAGVVSDDYKDGYENLEISSQSYVVLTTNDGISRLLFDKLENEFFTNEDHVSKYNGKEILEVLLNGNPMNAEVELWVPIKS
ncbi:effector binding domain-containing protein [Lysinibacillus sp. NPDC048646]|uniref:effector binding domain-containing protein n=1 Tax=Lysinibacillus sp. NPDC048646 TaxID=3390574 RepID=UPI003D022701